jgi:hypothetical protein
MRAAAAAALVGALLLGGCDASTPPREQRAGDVTVRGDDMELLSDPAEAPLPAGAAPMAWRVAGGTAGYGGAGQMPLLGLRCLREAGQLVIDRPGTGTEVTLSAGGIERSLPAEAAGGDRVAARVSLDDPLLVAMSAPQARIALATETGDRIDVPGGVAVRRVLDRCRTPAPLPVFDPMNDAAPAAVDVPALPPAVAPPPPVAR